MRAGHVCVNKHTKITKVLIVYGKGESCRNNTAYIYMYY